MLRTFSFENKLIILNSGIERKYEEICKISEIGDWKMFIIRIGVPKKLIIRRIKIKDKKRLKERPEDLERWFKEYKDFNQKVKSDFIFKKNSDLKNLFSKLDAILKR